MSELKDVSPISLLTGMTVLSLASGNKLGQILDLFIDPINGVLVGATLTTADGGVGELAYGEIYSFGRDALMAKEDQSVRLVDPDRDTPGQPASKLTGTKIITESGDVLGQINNIYVTLKPPPRIIYEARNSILDKLLGREFFVPASVGYALSDDASRLVVPDSTMEIAQSELADLVEQRIEVRSFDATRPSGPAREDDTIVIGSDDDETVVRFRDEDETVVRVGDDDDTVVRLRRPED
jgi:uncharacterized protein YrrD